MQLLAACTACAAMSCTYRWPVQSVGPHSSLELCHQLCSALLSAAAAALALAAPAAAAQACEAPCIAALITTSSTVRDAAHNQQSRLQVFV
jgi:hypothetical protein